MAHQPRDTLASPTRSAVLTRRGLVCSASPLAAAAGVRALHDGGNAFDAAIAVAASECVTLSPMCGLGGEVFALLYHASSGTLHGVSGCGRAPLAATREYFTSRGHTRMPLTGPTSASVPGEVHAWQTVLDRFGSRPLAYLIEPAILLAEEGFPIPFHLSKYYYHSVERLRLFPSSAAIFTRDGHPLGAADVLVQRNLARSLRRIAKRGPGALYQEELGQELVAAAQEDGGLMTTQDLAHHSTTVYESPPSVTYRGHTVYATAPPSQGFLVLEVLNMVEGVDLAAMGHNSADAVHVMAEAMKHAFADRLAYLGDPDFVPSPLDRLLSKEFAAERRSHIAMGRSAEAAQAGALAAASATGGTDTSYFCVVDAQGNAVSFIHSLSSTFGSGFVAGDTGILLNNRAGRGFFLEEGHPNVVAPGKRTMNTIQAFMVFNNGVPILVGGTPGGDSQPQWNVQVIANVVDYGMNVQEAAEAPRWNVVPGTDPGTLDQPYELRVDAGVPPQTLRELERRGHRTGALPPAALPGAVQLIALDPATGVRMGGTDPRCDGHPLAE